MAVLSFIHQLYLPVFIRTFVFILNANDESNTYSRNQTQKEFPNIVHKSKVTLQYNGQCLRNVNSIKSGFSCQYCFLSNILPANLFTLWPVFTCTVKFSLHFCFLLLHFSCKIVMIHFILALCTPQLYCALLCMFSCCDSGDAAATIVLLEHGKIVLIYLVYGITKVHLLFTILLW